MSFRTLVAGPRCKDTAAGWGLFVLRVSAGSMMLFAHGAKKLMNFGDLSARFADPLGVGTTASLSLAVFAEVFCAAALILGLATRWATVPLLVTMSVAAFVIHGDDPWQKKELALVYLVVFLTILIAGPGRAAVDNLIRGE
jgi:putative oxidoreductase